MENRETSKGRPVRLPKEEFSWELYEAEPSADGFKAVFGHENGAWVAIRPDVKPPQHEAQVFHPDGEISDKTELDLQMLVSYIEQTIPIRTRGGTKEGSETDAYNFALIA